MQEGISEKIPLSQRLRKTFSSHYFHITLIAALPSVLIAIFVVLILLRIEIISTSLIDEFSDNLYTESISSSKLNNIARAIQLT